MKESRRVHSVRDGATNEGQPVKDHGGLVGVLEQDLVGDIEDNGQEDQAAESNSNLRRQPKGLELMGERVARHLLEDAHCAKGGCCAFSKGKMRSAGRRGGPGRKTRRTKPGGRGKMAEDEVDPEEKRGSGAAG